MKSTSLNQPKVNFYLFIVDLSTNITSIVISFICLLFDFQGGKCCLADDEFVGTHFWENCENKDPLNKQKITTIYVKN